MSASYSEFAGNTGYKVEFYLNSITAITGPSNSGKSTYLDAIFKAFDKSFGALERRANLLEANNI